jgi:hypothetical protein
MMRPGMAPITLMVAEAVARADGGPVPVDTDFGQDVVPAHDGVPELRRDGIGWWYGTHKHHRINVRLEDIGWVGWADGHLVRGTFKSRCEAAQACVAYIDQLSP